MINIQFTSNGLPDDTFQILELNGEEEISHLFRFELRLVSRDPDIDFKSILESSAFIEITTQDKTRYIHGMLSEFEQAGAWHSGLYEYNAVLVPRLWMMTQSLQNQIYQQQSVPDIIESELDSIQQKGGHPIMLNGLTVADYELQTIRNYEQREYVVQYKETDFNFISRMMEHEGIFYYFEHDEEAEKVVITDEATLQQGAGPTPVMFQAEAAVTTYTYNAVSKLSRTQKQIPGSVLVKDYNYRSPSLPMQATGEVAVDGMGFVTEFGAHVKSPEEGEVLANVRAEEFRCRQNIYQGESNVSEFNCGQQYTLMNHFRDDYNQDYLITKVIHHASQAIQSWDNVGDTSYHNQFSCIPADIHYRPQRLTPKPKLYGIMNGIIDSEQDMNRADIDEEGRYKVLMPFDISGAAPGKASRRIRMAQPYGGGGTGMSFPLVKGTEVIWTCIDGDIDRPIITGTVPNPLNPSVTTTDNNTSNVIKTTGGILVSFNDGAGGSANKQSSSGDRLSAQQQNQKTERVNMSSPTSSNSATEELPLQQQETLTLSDTWKLGEDVLENDTNYQILVPHGSKKAYLRMGANILDETVTNPDSSSITVPTNSGWVDYTDDDRLSVTQGMKKEVINGGHYDLVINQGGLMTADAATLHEDRFRKVGNDWRRTTVGYLSSDTYTYGDSEEFFTGFKFDGMAGLNTSAFIGGNLDASAAVNVEIKAAFDISYGLSGSYTFVDGEDYTVTNEHKMEAKKKIQMYVEATEGEPNISGKKMAMGIAGIAAAVTAIGAAASAISATQRTGENDVAAEIGMGTGIAAATGVYAGAVAAALYAIKKQKSISKATREAQIVLGDDNGAEKIMLQAGNGKAADTTCSNIDMTKDSITLTVGNSSIVIKNDAILFISGDTVEVATGKGGVTMGKTVELKGLELIANEDITAKKAVNATGDVTCKNLAATAKVTGSNIKA